MRVTGSRQDDGEFLRAFGERIRAERARRGMSRRTLAREAGISERYINQLESGKGNISIVLLRRVAEALGLSLAKLVDEEPSPELTLASQFLTRLTPQQLREAHALLADRFAGDAASLRNGRIALVGLRGAGKSTLGEAIAGERRVPFVELDREVERAAGMRLAAILDMYGHPAYRRYELQALQELLETRDAFVVSTGGGIVSEPETYETLLRSCFTVWVRASPDEHMSRVIAQGDRRPMAGSAQAMDDLRRILEERSPLYARADLVLDTSGRSVDESIRTLRDSLPTRGE